MVRRLVDRCDDVLVIEEGYPFIERHLRGLLGVPGVSIRGKLSGDLPLAGELGPETVAAALGCAAPRRVPPLPDLAARPPQLCKGCPHTDSFRALVEAASPFHEPLMFSDIGCYALAMMPPFRAVHSCVDMGSSISMAHGASRTGAYPVICTIGDSTFAHSGMTPLIGAARHDADITVLVLDNSTVAMTGGQETLAGGERLVAILRGLGVAPDHLHVIDPHPRKHADNVGVIRREIEHRGLSVIVPTRPCIHVRVSAPPKASAKTPPREPAPALA